MLSVVLTMPRTAFLHFLAIAACAHGIKITFRNVSLWNGEEKLATIVESDSLSKFLPNETVKILRVVGYIPILYEDSVSNIKNVKKLEFHNNHIAEIQPKAFGSFDGVEVLEITAADFTLLGKGTFDNLNIERLTISSNVLEKIEVGAFNNLPKLNQLYITYSQKLESLEDGVFQNLNVETLLLNYNALRILPQNIFRNLPLLRNLLLKGNGIEQLQSEVFEGVPVERLDLSENLISIIPQGFFSKMEKLESVYLAKNRFTTIPSGVFTNHRHLKLVDLSLNGISLIASEAFDNMPNLERLDLALNNLTRIDPKWFHSTGSIVRLNFVRNSIIEIPNEAFANVYNEQLSKIDLSENSIKTVYPNAFKGLKRIHTLDLSLNEIGQWKANYLSDVDKIDTLDLFSNRIQCPEGDFDVVFKAQYTKLSGNPLDSNCLKRIEEWKKSHSEDGQPRIL